MARQAEVQGWPSRSVLDLCLRQFESMSIGKGIDRLESDLDWLLKVYPGCAILIVRDAHRLPEGLRHAVLTWGHDNLWPGNYDATGLEDPPPGVAEKGQKGEGAKGNEGKSKVKKNHVKGNHEPCWAITSRWQCHWQ